MNAVESVATGFRYGNFWALRDCTVSLPQGSITAVVGPNGAGKTTLLNLLVGLLPPSDGELAVLGRPPANDREFLGNVGFVAQDCPLYKEFTVSDLLSFGRHMNPRWDDSVGRARLDAANIPVKRKAGRLSGGQRAQVALALAVAKQPDLLVLDEPLASLDPLARREFLQGLMATASSSSVSIVLSSHLVGDMARVCDYLLVIAEGRLRLSGEIDSILDEHMYVAGSLEDTAHLPDGVQVIERSNHDRHARLIVRAKDRLLNPALTSSPVELEDLVLAYLGTPTSPQDRLLDPVKGAP
jgi:ABC-2 type transport system ATP-binding protein